MSGSGTKISAQKPTAPTKSMKSRLQTFIGSYESGKVQKRQVIDPLTNQRIVKFNMDILEEEREEMKILAKTLNMTMNEFVIEAIREKIDKHTTK